MKQTTCAKALLTAGSLKGRPSAQTAKPGSCCSPQNSTHYRFTKDLKFIPWGCRPLNTFTCSPWPFLKQLSGIWFVYSCLLKCVEYRLLLIGMETELGVYAVSNSGAIQYTDIQRINRQSLYLFRLMMMEQRKNEKRAIVTAHDRIFVACMKEWTYSIPGPLSRLIR